MDDSRFTVRLTTWDADAPALRAVRRDVFVIEQRIPESLEWDDHDVPSVHALAVDRQGRPVGTGRLLPDGRIGRMAVLASWRGRGVGRALLRSLIGEAVRRGHAECRLDAQVHAIAFYEQAGFRAFGPEFDDAGIPHRAMRLSLPQGSGSGAPAAGRG